MLRNILVELDAFMDTRGGTLRRTVPDEAMDVINSREYRFREHNEMHKLCSIDEDRWKEAWKLRDAKTVYNSGITLLVPEFINVIREIQSIIDGNNPELTDIRLLINIYPYKLTQDQEEAIITGIRETLSLNCEVATVYLPLNQIDPADCARLNIFMLFLYNFTDWIQAAYGDEKKWSENNLPRSNDGLTVVAPRIKEDRLGIQKEIDDLKVQGVELPESFELTAETFNLLFRLEFITANSFCELTEEAKRIIAEGMKNGASN